jgi:DNA-binding response OmpR family regulator
MATKATILIVDDQPMNLRVLCHALERADYTVRVVDSGAAAIASARFATPDLILLDVMMPHMDGFDACRHLKSDDTTRDAPVIFMTALSDPIDEVAGLQLGAVDYITKPIQIETLLARVDTHLTIGRLQRMLHRQYAELDAYARLFGHDLNYTLWSVLREMNLICSHA